MKQNLILPDWPAPAHIKAFTTTRAGGQSTPPFDTFNLAQHVGDTPKVVEQNREALRQILPSEPVWLNQTHSNNVVLVDGASSIEGENDGSITFDDNIVCTVMTADCLPLLLTDRQGSFVAAVHAGWRGLANGIIAQCLQQISDSSRHEVLAWLGPAIGADAFEVGDDVKAVFIGLSEDNAAAFNPHGQKWLCDIYMLARLQLGELGVKNIYGGEHCTYSRQDKFFSYRRDGQCGRMASCIYSLPL